MISVEAADFKVFFRALIGGLWIAVKLEMEWMRVSERDGRYQQFFLSCLVSKSINTMNACLYDKITVWNRIQNRFGQLEPHSPDLTTNEPQPQYAGTVAATASQSLTDCRSSLASPHQARIIISNASKK